MTYACRLIDVVFVHLMVCSASASSGLSAAACMARSGSISAGNLFALTHRMQAATSRSVILLLLCLCCALRESGCIMDVLWMSPNTDMLTYYPPFQIFVVHIYKKFMVPIFLICKINVPSAEVQEEIHIVVHSPLKTIFLCIDSTTAR